ncbi:hypothetical protein SprV_0200666400 [Sparganum proliferum]
MFRRLKFLTAESDTTVSSSAQFLEKLRGDLAIETIELLLQNKYDETENRLGRAQVLQLLKLCLRTYFTFDGTIYEQVKGTPMGSPISGFIAEAVLQRLESLVFQHHKPKFWARYVDDTFVVIDQDQLLTFKERLNAVFPDIQFTMEEEENNQLAFLDVLLCRKDCGGLTTNVFRKATNTMQVLNFNSNHPISHKRSCVRTLYRRVETHCSEPEDKIAELQYLRRVFKANGYPLNFVNRTIITDTSVEDSVNTCPHCNCTLTSHTDLVGHLRIHRAGTGKPGPGVPTYTRCIRLDCPDCPRTFMHRMGLIGHRRIPESGNDRNLDTPNTSSTPTLPILVHAPQTSAPTATSSIIPSASSTPTMLSPTHTRSPRAPASTSSNAIITVDDTDNADFSCPHCHRTFTSRIGLVGHLRIHRT